VHQPHATSLAININRNFARGSGNRNWHNR